ncbi:MAG: DNA polymerase Y family protein [Gammaproteobacteria bacterium]|nr:DNA polymerase Y family protein [Gammaproteobacteria bacterium]MDE2250537.1 DNA polymerase Y family protein [Gammaproteobacteria bacterium]
MADIRMQWLCILLPRFALEAAAGPAGGAHSESGTRSALATLALWALQWSSQVSERAGSDDAQCIAAAHGAALWLEIGASRALFGDHAALRARLAAELGPLGYEFRLGSAPTPQGATILARAGLAGGALTRAQLLRQLAPLPLGLLSLPDEQLAALHAAGLRRIGELLPLPAAAIARRFGPAASLYLQRLRGAAREPQHCVRPPARFTSRCEFPDAIGDATALLFPLQRLLAGLQGYLRSLDRAVQRYTLCLEHHRAAATRLAIGLARPGRDAVQFLALARERLAATALAAPVHGLRVEADELLQPLILQDDLFACATQQAGQLQHSLDRLAARLGRDAVRTLDRSADHRPERAWRLCAARLTAQPGALPAPPPVAQAPDRPCWLLPEPRRIDMPRELLAGPERIESGWWDGADIARDYYLARGEHGAQLWVYNDLRSGAWCLHGLWA